MRQVQIKYKSGNAVKVNFTGTVNVKYKDDSLTKISIDGMVGGAHPLFYGLDHIESVSVVSIGWQRVFEYVFGFPVRVWRAVTGANSNEA